jgi:recombination protein RecR
MSALPKALQKLIEQFAKLPGIGPKTASRLSFSMLNWSQAELEEFSQSVSDLRRGIHFCPDCYTMSEGGLCEICCNNHRDRSVVAVVAKPLDVIALESTGDYNGLYHVLGGVITPIEGVGPENLKIEELIHRIKKQDIKEVILATNADLEGETTAMYIAKHLKDLDVKITRIARGLPIGGELEYADEVTLTSALEGRREYGK